MLQRCRWEKLYEYYPIISDLFARVNSNKIKNWDHAYVFLSYMILLLIMPIVVKLVQQKIVSKKCK